MPEGFHSENQLLKKELTEDLPIRKLPFLMDVSGRNVEVSVEYAIEPERIIGICGECKKENQSLFREKVSGEVKVVSDDAEAILVAQEKIRALVEGVENEMLCCEDCFTEEFIRTRPEKYLQAMQNVSGRLGIMIDMEELRKAVVK